MGCGGVGGVATGMLTEAGADVTAFTTNEGIAAMITQRGLVLRERPRIVRRAPPPRTIQARVVTKLEGTFDAVLLCTQPPQVEEAARMALPVLARDGVMVCLQNGLCEPRVASIAGPSRTVGAVVAWGAAMPEAGVYERTALGGFAVGAYDEQVPSEKVESIARALEPIGRVEVTQNLPGKRWSKLAINAAISSLGAIGGDRLGALLQHRFVRRLALEIMSECVRVSRGLGVRLEKVSGTVDLDWLALQSPEPSWSLASKHAMLLAVGFRYRRMRSSMLAAIERGRVPAVDFLNGEVSTHGREVNVLTPFNDAARRMVWEIARSERQSGMESLRALATEAASSPVTRGALRA